MTSKSLLKEVVLEQREILDNMPPGITREILTSLKEKLKLPHILVISGMRRVGKSTLLKQIIDKYYKDQNIYYLNFEDERLIEFTAKDFNKLYEAFYEIYGESNLFIFDEIQNVDRWEKFARRICDKGQKLIITGSNSSLLSKDLGTKITGRYLPVTLFPFSFREFLAFNNYFPGKNWLSITKERGRVKGYFNDYLKSGGMPEFLKYEDRDILKMLYNDILYRDIVARNKIQQIKVLRETSLYLLSNISSLFTYNRIKNSFNINSVNTVKKYIEFLEDSFLLFVVNGFSYSYRKQILNPKKAYCVDNGLIDSVAFNFTENKGKYLENLVFLELKRRGEEVYYYKTSANREVDFIIKEGKQNEILIQVSMSIMDPEVKKREIKALKEALEELNIPSALILCDDEEGEIQLKDKDIKIKPVYKWLLEN